MPSILSVGYGTTRVDIDKAYIKIKEVFKLSDAQMISNNLYDIGSTTSEKNQVLILIKKNLIISFDFMFHYTFSIFYCDDTDLSLIEKIKVIMKDCKREIKPNYTYFLISENSKLALKAFKIEAPADDVILTNYNDDFIEVDRIIKEKLQDPNGKGLVLLHGLPGTGKSFYIKYLISVLKKRVIYMPPDMVHIISSPDFIKFISDFPGSVIVMEDSEQIIQQRSGGNNTTISNILNLTDGIMGDCLKLQILCTFNSPLASVDRALLRPGRLLGIYEFGELSQKKCEQVLKKLGIDKDISRKMTLAELYNMNEPDFKKGTESNKIGFNTSTK